MRITLEIPDQILHTLLDEVAGHAQLEALAPAEPLAFDADGNLRDLGQPGRRLVATGRASG